MTTQKKMFKRINAYIRLLKKQGYKQSYSRSFVFGNFQTTFTIVEYYNDNIMADASVVYSGTCFALINKYGLVFKGNMDYDFVDRLMAQYKNYDYTE